MRLTALLSALLLSAPLAAEEYEIGALRIMDPVIYTPFAGARAVAGYMEIANTGSETDELVGVQVEGLRAMIHESREVDGVMTMEHRDAVALGAGQSVSFAPGGLHIMIMGVAPGSLSEGTQIEATLIFEEAGQVPIVFTVQNRPEDGADTGQ